MSEPAVDKALTGAIIAAQAIRCAECDFTILPGQHMTLWVDGWRHITCLPTPPHTATSRSAA